MLMLVRDVMELATLERLAVEDERLLAGRALTVLQEPVLLLHRDRERIQSWVTGEDRTLPTGFTDRGTATIRQSP